MMGRVFVQSNEMFDIQDSIRNGCEIMKKVKAVDIAEHH